MSVVIRLKVPIEMHYAVIPMGNSKVNSSQEFVFNFNSELMGTGGLPIGGYAIV